MHLPVTFHLFGLNLPAHMVFEYLAYAVGFRLYLWLRQVQKDTLDNDSRMVVLIGAILGAGLGSKLLGLAEHPELWHAAQQNLIFALTAKSILGALLGGLIGVEIAKEIAHVTRSTGDIYVFPLLIAMLVGRIGCFLAGISDGTWGTATTLPFGLDGGDGILRHPTPLYEIAFLGLSGIFLWFISPKLKPNQGSLFKLFLALYCLWRFLIEFLKPVIRYDPIGLSFIQMAALLMLLYYGFEWTLRRQRGAN